MGAGLTVASNPCLQRLSRVAKDFVEVFPICDFHGDLHHRAGNEWQGLNRATTDSERLVLTFSKAFVQCIRSKPNAFKRATQYTRDIVNREDNSPLV